MAVLGLLSPQLFDDSGQNIPEPRETLRAQQGQLIAGLRPAQMFPTDTIELPLPSGFDRVETDRGVFHFNPDRVSADDVRQLSNARRENELLGLGPYNKAEILERARKGETVLVVTERTSDGIEVRAAAGTDVTAPTQLKFFERTKTPGNVIAIEALPHVLSRRISPARGVNNARSL